VETRSVLVGIVIGAVLFYAYWRFAMKGKTA